MIPPFARAAFTALCLSAPAFLGAQETGTGVKPGDQVITDFYTAGGEQIASVEGNRLVDRDGNVFLPFVGTVHVDGLDAEQIRALLVQKYQPFYTDPVVTVNVLLRVNITGVVGAPGHYFLDPTTTIVDALAEAGGVGSEIEGGSGGGLASNPAAVRLVRDGRPIILDLRPEVADPGMLEMRVQSGDWIHVPSRPRSRFRDDVQFWGSIVSLFSAIVAAVVVIKN